MPHAPSASAIEPRLRRARSGVSALFFINAALYANLVPRLPEVKEHLALGNAALGSAIAAMPVGALLAGLLAPALIQRLGSARVASFGLIALGVAIAGVPLCGAWAVLAALMALVGALDAVVDVAQNAHGFRVQRAYGRSIVNAFHGLWSVGAVLGGLFGSAAAGLSVPLAAHLGASAALFGVAALLAYRGLLPGPEDAERVPAAASGQGAVGQGAVGQGAGGQGAVGQGAVGQGAVGQGAVGQRAVGQRAGGQGAGGERRPRRLPGHAVPTLAALGALAACGAFVEDAGSSWGALYLRGEVGAGAAAGGLAFVALQVAMTAGRLTGDRVVDRFGQRRVAAAGGAAITVGMTLALAFPSIGTTLTGFAMAGLGVATLIPAVMHTADELPGLPHGVGLTIVSWLLRVGFLVSPSAVGLVADATSLRVALSGVVLAGLGVLVLGRVLSDRAFAAGGETVPVEAGNPSAGPTGPGG